MATILTSLLPLLVLGVLAALILALKPLLQGGGKSGRADAYVLQKAILSPAERSFLGVLEPVLPPEIGVVVKIRLGDVFAVRPGLGRPAATGARNAINQKHVDFLLVRTTDLAPVAGIELDDKSHQRADRQKRDAFVDEVFRGCGLPLLHVPAQATYSPADLRSQLSALLNPAPAARAA